MNRTNDNMTSYYIYQVECEKNLYHYDYRGSHNFDAVFSLSKGYKTLQEAEAKVEQLKLTICKDIELQIEPRFIKSPYPRVEYDWQHNKRIWREIDEDHYNYYLEVLPPVEIRRSNFLKGEAAFHNDNGEAVYLACCYYLDNCYAMYMTVNEYKNSFYSFTHYDNVYEDKWISLQS